MIVGGKVGSYGSFSRLEPGVVHQPRLPALLLNGSRLCLRLKTNDFLLYARL